MERRPTSNEFNVIRGILNESLGVNLRAYQATKTAQRKGRLYQKQLETRPEMGWSGDSSTVPDLQKTTGGTQRGTDAEHFVKQQVIKLMSAAQERGIEMTHGEAHQVALDMLKKHMGQA